MCFKQSLFCKRVKKRKNLRTFAKKKRTKLKKRYTTPAVPNYGTCQHRLFLLDNGREATVTVHGHRKVANGEGHTSVFVFRAPVRTLDRS